MRYGRSSAEVMVKTPEKATISRGLQVKRRQRLIQNQHVRWLRNKGVAMSTRCADHRIAWRGASLPANADSTDSAGPLQRAAVAEPTPNEGPLVPLRPSNYYVGRSEWPRPSSRSSYEDVA